MDWMQVFFQSGPGLLRTMVAAVFAYASMIVVLRVAGKHALSKLHVFDYVVTVALGSTLASILVSEDVALAEGLVAVVTLVGMQWVVAKAAVSFEPWRKFVRSDPVILIDWPARRRNHAVRTGDGGGSRYRHPHARLRRPGDDRLCRTGGRRIYVGHFPGPAGQWRSDARPAARQ